MAIAAPLHAERVPKDAVGDHFEAVRCWGEAFRSPKTYWWRRGRRAPPTLCNVIAQKGRVGEVLFEAPGRCMHSVLRNEAGHVRRQRSDRLVYLHTLAQEVAVLSNSGLVDDVFGQGGLVRFVVVGS